MDQEAWLKPFSITSVCREDLRGILSDGEIAGLDDADMREIAEHMADAYCESVFWIDLPIMAEQSKGSEQEAGSSSPPLFVLRFGVAGHDIIILLYGTGTCRRCRCKQGNSTFLVPHRGGHFFWLWLDDETGAYQSPGRVKNGGPPSSCGSALAGGG